LGVGGGNIFSNRSVNDGQWHHVAAVLQEPASGPASVQNLRLYIDGQLDAGTYTNPTVEINTGTDCSVRIGVMQKPDGALESFFGGQIDEVRIYDRALSESEIQSLLQ
ncbi:MAG TPA: LamG domain-containing protein, partial [Anaerohalosphaeraceae bacterium]|nr:LamG domain-containing protein [Anaerohalosphaeraceae bacterium]